MGEYTDEELALLTPAEREGLLGEAPASDRDRHMEWCKERALEYVDSGDLRNAVASMLSDLKKHPSTAGSASGGLAMIGMLDAAAGDASAVERWIEGFN